MSEPALKALVVDDNADDRELIARRLNRAGFAASEADGGNAALEALDGADFDIVFLDINMPGMSGFDVLAKLRGHRAGDVPVIMLSASRDSFVERTARQLGAAEFVTKPVDFNAALPGFQARAAVHAAARAAAA